MKTWVSARESTSTRLAAPQPLDTDALCPSVFIGSFIFLDGSRGYVPQIPSTCAVYKWMHSYKMKRNPASRELAAQLLSRYGLHP